MQRIIIQLSAVFVVLSSGVVHAASRAGTGQSEGLVAHYRLDGDAMDSSQAGNHGTISGGVQPTEDRDGNPSGAMYFNGAGQYIHAAATDLPTGERTMAFWFLAESVDQHPVPLGYGGLNCGQSFWVALNNADSIFQNSYSLQGHCQVNKLIAPYSKAPVGIWKHWAISTSSSGTEMYVDGLLIASNSIFVSNTHVAGRDLSIGVCVSPSGFAPYTDGNIGYFKGSLDDVRIYDRALSAAEIEGLAGTGSGTPLCFGDGSGSLCPCLYHGNLGEGCGNSAGVGGAILVATGSPSFANDDFQFAVTGLPGITAGLCVKGSFLLGGGMGTPVGEGILCTAPQIRSQVIVSGPSGTAVLSDWRGQPIGTFPSAANVGMPTYYQWWFRDVQNSCAGYGFNFSNAWEVTWF